MGVVDDQSLAQAAWAAFRQAMAEGGQEAPPWDELTMVQRDAVTAGAAAVRRETAKARMPVITAAGARDNDVVWSPADRSVYQLIANQTWGNITPVGSYGPPWAPEGNLVLLVRDGQPQGGGDAP